MLGGRIEDGVESDETEAAGLGLLPVETFFEEEKVLGRPEGRASNFGGAEVSGYEIHHGRVRRDGGDPLFKTGGDTEGCMAGATLGTSWHGILESDGFRRALLRWVAGVRSRDWSPGEASFAAAREAQLEKLGDLVADHVDHEALMRLIDEGQPPGLPFVSSQLVSQSASQQAEDAGTAGAAGASCREGEGPAFAPLASTMSGSDEQRSIG
jgi:adenosylcobyric acid synthase